MQIDIPDAVQFFIHKKNESDWQGNAICFFHAVKAVVEDKRDEVRITARPTAEYPSCKRCTNDPD